MSNAMLRPICRAIHTGIFQSKEYRSLPSDGQARLLLLCLLIHPHGGTFHLPGLYHVGNETLREAASMPRRSFMKALDDLVESGLVQHDQENRLLWIPAALKLVGPPGNPNVAKGYARSLGQLPMSKLVTEAVESYRSHLEAFGEAFLEPFAKAFERVSDAFEAPERSLQKRIAKASDNSNKDKDINCHHHSNRTGGMDRSSFLAFASRVGWVGVSEGKVTRLLEDAPSLTLQDLEDFGHRIADRDDVRDPLAYLRSIYTNRRRGAVGLEHREPTDERHAKLPEDGAEMKFDD